MLKKCGFLFCFFLELLLPTVESVKRNDIGYPFIKQARSSELTQRLEWVKKQKNDASLEKLAKNNQRKKILIFVL